jgi:hypothetical protein
LPPLASAINVFDGEITNRAMGETFGLLFNPRFAR